MNDEQIVELCNTGTTMSNAAMCAGMKYAAFRKLAKRLGCWKPNQSGKGCAGERNVRKIPLIEILEGKHPTYGTSKILVRLVEEGYKAYKCDRCGIAEWMGTRIGLQIHHRDGNSRNHKYNNLEVLCPNCHSQTDTFGSKNIERPLGGMADTHVLEACAEKRESSSLSEATI